MKEKKEEDIYVEGEDLPEINLEGIKPIAKKGTAVLGILCGLGGIVLAVVMIVLISGAISNAKTELSGQMDSIKGVVTSMETGITSMVESTGDLKEGVDNASEAIEGFSAGSETIADALEGLADNPLVTGDTEADLLLSAEQIRNSSSQLMESSVGFSSFGGGLEGTSQELGEAVDDLNDMKNELNSTKGDIENLFDSINLGILIIGVMFILLFAGLIVYGASILL